MSNKLIPILFGFLFFLQGLAQHDKDRHVVIPKISPALKFTENLGQWQDNILFKATLNGGAMYVEKNALTFSFFDQKKYAAIHHGGIAKGKYKDLNIQCHAYKMHFENCNPVTQVDKMQQGSDYENFYIGNDESKWKSDVKNYHQVIMKDLYNRIDYE